MAKKGKLHRSASDTSQAKAYASRYADNRIARLERHLKRQPDDVQAQKALKRAQNGDVPYRRQKPKKSWLTPSDRLWHRALRDSNARQHPRRRLDNSSDSGQYNI